MLWNLHAENLPTIKKRQMCLKQNVLLAQIQNHKRSKVLQHRFRQSTERRVRESQTPALP
jgi:hypothetical protein